MTEGADAAVTGAAVLGGTAGRAGAGERTPVVLVGFMGAGKTTVGRLVAARTGLAFADSDLVVEAREGRRVRDVFATDGEARFRELEHAAVVDLLAGDAGVIALGGGACGHAGTRAALAGHLVVHLEVPLDEVLRRVGGDPSRPVLARPDLPALHRDRLAVYRDVATHTVRTAGRSGDEVAADVVRLLTAPEPAPASAPAAAPVPEVPA